MVKNLYSFNIKYALLESSLCYYNFSGKVPKDKAKLYSELYNDNYDLGISDEARNNALHQSSSGDKVTLDSYLRILCTHGPWLSFNLFWFVVSINCIFIILIVILKQKSNITQVVAVINCIVTKLVVIVHNLILLCFFYFNVYYFLLLVLLMYILYYILIFYYCMKLLKCFVVVL